jgi:hypothetical protein
MALGQFYLCSCIKFRHVAQNIKDKMCPIRILHSVIILEIFFVVKEFIIKNQSRNIIFFYKMMNLNFPSSNKVLGLGRSIL